jgi:hypothetical protein
LAVLKNLDELAGLQQRVMGSGVQPCGATAQVDEFGVPWATYEISRPSASASAIP